MQIKRLDQEARNSLAKIIKHLKKICNKQPKHILLQLLRNHLIQYRLNILQERNIKTKFIMLVESEKIFEIYNKIIKKWEKKINTK